MSELGLRKIADTLRSMATNAGDASMSLIEAVADEWIDVAHETMGIDTSQLWNRTAVVDVSRSGAGATADLVADTPYAGWHNYGSYKNPPNRFWNDGQRAAWSFADAAAEPLEASIASSMKSGGTWKPHKVKWSPVKPYRVRTSR